MNSRAALIQFGKVIAHDIGSGRLGEMSRMVGEALALVPQASCDLVDLAVSEARKKRPNESLVAAYGFMVGQTLEMLRYGIERADPSAIGAVAAVREKLLALARSGQLGPGLLMLLSRQFATAKLDIGDELRGLVGAKIEAGSGLLPNPAAGPSAEGFLTDLSQALGGDAFAIHAELSESASAVPNEHRIAIAHAMSNAPVVPVREAALGWLFDASRDVRIGTAEALAAAAREGRLTRTTSRRLIVARSWMAEADRGAIDTAITACRRNGIEPLPNVAVQSRGTLISGFDGAGAQSIFVVLKSGRKHTLASLLLKQGIGVRDAWVRRDLSKADVEDFIGTIGEEIGVFDGSLNYLRIALAHFLSVNQGSGVLPPFGLLDFVETVGLEAADPEPLSVEQVTARLLETAGPREDLDVEEAIAASSEWPDGYEFMDSWFEDDASVGEVLAGKRLTKAKRISLVLERVLGARRRRWAELLAWSAMVLHDSGGDEEAMDFALVVRELLGDRPISDIPLMHAIAAATVEAWKARHG